MIDRVVHVLGNTLAYMAVLLGGMGVVAMLVIGIGWLVNVAALPISVAVLLIALCVVVAIEEEVDRG